MEWRRALCTALMVSYGLIVAACANREPPLAPATAPASSPAKNEMYIVVQRGQTLDVVADTFRITKAEIIALNDLKPPYRLKPGSILKMPATVAELNVETQPNGGSATLRSPPSAATAATMPAPSAAAPERARRPARPKTSEKPQPSAPQIIPLD